MRFDPQSGFTPGQHSGPASPGAAASIGLSTLAGKAIATTFVTLSALLAIWIWRQQTEGVDQAVGAAAELPGEASIDSAIPAVPATGAIGSVDASSNQSVPDDQSQHTDVSPSTDLQESADLLPAPLRLRRSGDALAQGKEQLAIGQTARAIELLTDAVELDPDSAEAHYNLGLAYVLRGDVASARQQRDTLRTMDRNLASLLGNLVR